MAAEPTTTPPQPEVRERGARFAAVHLGALEALERFQVTHPRSKRSFKGKVFLKDALGLSGLEVSLNRFPKGAAMPFAHKHRENEEVYLFVRGQGEMLVDGQVIPVSEGSLVRIAPEGVRSLRSTGDSDLYYVCIQGKSGTLQGSAGSDGVGVEGPVVWPT